MDLRFDHGAMRELAGFAPPQSDDLASPDWFGLKARFVAAHALRREFESQSAATALGGSFTSETAHVLASRRQTEQAVNLKASAICKAPHANEANIADHYYPAREE